MTVAELIAALAKMPQDADVGYVWDGAHRSDVDRVYLARSGVVLIIDDLGYTYHDEDKPADPPPPALPEQSNG